MNNKLANVISDVKRMYSIECVIDTHLRESETRADDIIGARPAQLISNSGIDLSRGRAIGLLSR